MVYVVTLLTNCPIKIGNNKSKEIPLTRFSHSLLKPNIMEINCKTGSSNMSEK